MFVVLCNERPIMDCAVCCDSFNGSTRKQVVCKVCAYAACMACSTKYLLETTQNPHCMNCRTGWTREFLFDNFTNKFVNKDYKNHREVVLFERERSLMPSTQPYVEILKKVDNLQKEKDELQEKIQTYQKHKSDAYDSMLVSQQYNDIDEIMNFRRQLGVYNYKTVKCEEEMKALDYHKNLLLNRSNTANAERRAFVRACPADDCRGFLSTQWKCGLCDARVCKECHEIKQIGDTETEHTCKPESIETAKLLAKDTKACPKCAALIFKIEGCFAADTVIPLYNGGTKMSQDILAGDILIGDDGSPRTVLETTSGEDTMYRIKQVSGVEYIVNSQHKLVLKHSGDKVIYWKECQQCWEFKWFDHVELSRRTEKVYTTLSKSKQQARADIENLRDKINTPDTIEITVDDFMKLNKSTKKHLMGFKSQGVNWTHHEVKVDPYVLGVWIGDGVKTGNKFAANDNEIIEYLLQWCDNNDAELVHDSAYTFRVRRKKLNCTRAAIGHGSSISTCVGCAEKVCSLCDITSTTTYSMHKDSSNPLMTQLREYGLVGEKQIPLDYIINDEQTRLQLLAGIIDTDGYVPKDGKRAIIIQTDAEIVRRITFIAQSLGFTVRVATRNMNNVVRFNSAPRDYKMQYIINISGQNLCDIPTKVSRKRCLANKPNKDWCRTSIEVAKIGFGKFYGWQIDGNKRFTLSDFTVVHNCDQMFCTQCHSAFSWRTGQLETGRIHNPHYYEYLRRSGGNVPREIGDVPCGGIRNWGAYSMVLYKILGVNSGTRSARHYYGAATLPSTLDLANPPPAVMIDVMSVVHRLHGHIEGAELPRFRVPPELNTRDLRAKYMLGKISEEQFKKELQKTEKAREKANDIYMVLQTFQAVCTDLLQRLYVAKDADEVSSIYNELKEIRNYTNANMLPISKRFHCVVPCITDRWQIQNDAAFPRPSKKKTPPAQDQASTSQQPVTQAAAGQIPAIIPPVTPAIIPPVTPAIIPRQLFMQAVNTPLP